MGSSRSVVYCRIAPSTFYEHEARRRDPARLPSRVKRDTELRVEIDRVGHENRPV